MNRVSPSVFHGLSGAEIRKQVVELCERGLLTCTRGRPGEEGSTYAVAWLPLDQPEQFSAEVRELHEANMRALGLTIEADS